MTWFRVALNKARGFSNSIKKVIIAMILFVLAVPLLTIILLNLGRRMARMESTEIINQESLTEAEVVSSGLTDDILKNIEESIKELENIEASLESVTSTATTSVPQE